MLASSWNTKFVLAKEDRTLDALLATAACHALLGVGVGLVTGIGAPAGALLLVAANLVSQGIRWLGREVFHIPATFNPLTVRVVATSLSIFAALQLCYLMGHPIGINTGAIIAIGVPASLAVTAVVVSIATVTSLVGSIMGIENK